MFAPTDKLDTTKAARYCGVGKSTLEKLRLTGGGPTYLKPTRSVVYQVSDLDAWLESKIRTSTSDGGPLAKPAQPLNPVSRSVWDDIRARYNT